MQGPLSTPTLPAYIIAREAEWPLDGTLDGDPAFPVLLSPAHLGEEGGGCAA